MAASKKRRQHNNSPSDDESGGDSETSGEHQMEVVDVDFDVKAPDPDDKEGIKNLLQQLFLKSHINTSELADLLIEQNSITNVLKQADNSDGEDDGDEDMDIDFCVFSVINLTVKKDVECIKQIISYLLNHCQEVCSKDQYENFKSILEDSNKHVGLIISERFVNIPFHVAKPLYSALKQDIVKLKEKEPFDFAYYLFICKTLVFNTESAESYIYINAEEEIVSEFADFSFDFPVQDEQDSALGGRWTDEDAEGTPKRKILLLPASKWDLMYDKIVENTI